MEIVTTIMNLLKFYQFYGKGKRKIPDIYMGDYALNDIIFVFSFDLLLSVLG
jgi:hypothetical protein